MKEVDIIIIGAGPAGCSAAIRARQAGRSVILLEASPHPKKSPGETLHPGIEPLFKQLGIIDQIKSANFPRHCGVWFENDGQRQFIPYGEDDKGPWLGFQADRRKLQQIFQDHAIHSQAKLIINVRPEQLVVENNRVMGVIAGGEIYRAQWTLDASGRQSWLAEQLGLSKIICSPPLTAKFGWRQEENFFEIDKQPCFAFHQHGWSWQAPIGENQLAWSELLIGNAPVGIYHPQGIDVTWSIRIRCAGPGYILLGDAAAMLDPSSSHGVLRAIMSGLMAGHLLAGTLNGDILEKNVIEIYPAWLHEIFYHDVVELRQQYVNSAAGNVFKQSFSELTPA